MITARPRTGSEFDVFISYRRRQPDQDWVRERLTQGLRRLGVRVCLDDDESVAGENLIEQMEDGILRSRCTLMVLSPAYLEGGFARVENIMAARLGDRDARRRLLAVVLEPCE